MNRTSGLRDWSKWLLGWMRLEKNHAPGHVYSTCLNAWRSAHKSLEYNGVADREGALRASDEVVEWLDFGAGCPAEGKLRKSRVSDMAKSASSDPRKGRWLSAVTQAAAEKTDHPLRILELGTCLGSGGDFLLSGAPKGSSYVGLEGSNALADWTKRRLQGYVEEGARVDIETGPFEQTLPQVVSAGMLFDVVFLDGCHEGEALLNQWRDIQPLLSSNFIVVVDDIRWSKDMYAAWLQLTEGPVEALDVFRMGLLTPQKRPASCHRLSRVTFRQRA